MLRWLVGHGEGKSMNGYPFSTTHGHREDNSDNWRNNTNDGRWDGVGEAGTRDSINGSFAWKTYCARSNSIKKSSLLSLCLSLSHSACPVLPFPLSPFSLSRSVAPSRVCLVSNWPRACVFLGCRCCCWRCKRHAISGCKYLKYSIAAWRTYMESGSMFGLFTARPASYSPKGCQVFRLRASSENIR